MAKRNRGKIRRVRDDQSLRAPLRLPNNGSDSVVSLLGNAAVQRRLHLAEGNPSIVLTRAYGKPFRGAVARAAIGLQEGLPAQGEEQISGQIPAMEPEEASEEEMKGPCDCSTCAAESSGAPSASDAPSKPVNQAGFQLDVGSIHVNYRRQEMAGAPRGRSHDAVEVGTVSHTFAKPGNLAVKPFGSESFRPAHSGATYKAEGGKLKLDFTIDINAPWGVNDGGNTDVPSGTDAVVTAEDHASGKKVYEQIKSDLTPVKKGGSMVPPRTYYWAKDLTSRHEEFHSDQDETWSKGAGTKVVTDYLKGKSVSGATADAVKAEVQAHLDAAIKAMSTANFDWYSGGGKAYNDRPGEIGASDAVKDDYKARGEAAAKHGAKLEAEKAAEGG